MGAPASSRGSWSHVLWGPPSPPVLQRPPCHAAPAFPPTPKPQPSTGSIQAICTPTRDPTTPTCNPTHLFYTRTPGSPQKRPCSRSSPPPNGPGGPPTRQGPPRRASQGWGWVWGWGPAAARPSSCNRPIPFPHPLSGSSSSSACADGARCSERGGAGVADFRSAAAASCRQRSAAHVREHCPRLCREPAPAAPASGAARTGEEPGCRCGPVFSNDWFRCRVGWFLTHTWGDWDGGTEATHGTLRRSQSVAGEGGVRGRWRTAGQECFGRVRVGIYGFLCRRNNLGPVNCSVSCAERGLGKN